MKKVISILGLVLICSNGFAAEKAELDAFDALVKKDIAIGVALFDCVGDGKQIQEIYEKHGLIKSADARCQESLEEAFALGATREDFFRAIGSKLRK